MDEAVNPVLDEWWTMNPYASRRGPISGLRELASMFLEMNKMADGKAEASGKKRSWSHWADSQRLAVIRQVSHSLSMMTFPNAFGSPQ